jgi:UDPglucose 6-dehydrogenase
MNIAVVGTGYVGLVVGAGLAESGNDVVCADIDDGKIERLNRGEIPILRARPRAARGAERRGGAAHLHHRRRQAVAGAEIVFIAVGTPPGEDGSADLKHVLAVAETIGRNMGNGREEKIVVTKSTVPVGTARKVRETIARHTDRDFHVCSNPEFLKEGAAVDDFMKPDRVIIGAESVYAREKLADLYGPFMRTGDRVLFMDVASAEISKYAANAMLATRISFMNMIAGLCEATGGDVTSVRLGIGSDERIGPSFLFPGVGYGGSCFPKDVKALIRTLREHGVDTSILEGVETVNERQKRLLLERIEARFGSDLTGKTFAVWGLAFKPNTDDMREAPSLTVIPGLVERGAKIRAHDPEAMTEARRYLAELVRGGDVSLCERNYDCLEGADALVVLTEWQPYRHPNLARLRDLMATPVVFDGRNLWDPQKMAELGFEYESIGRPKAGVGAEV